MKTLQIVHRKAGVWLSSQISGSDPRPNETLIDVNLGLRVSDLLDSVTAHTGGAVDPARAPSRRTRWGTYSHEHLSEIVTQLA
ncbi:hypothetical protein [Streptomyces alanosinicus]|uniref:Uncharacterized protein n=1 Tax=Streptomyces alanosinicus TaxID=68171 RepID=A0A918YQK9_9ACTN|nr:hypothetical protein [Streptomyces alanosinicus]GHE11392.1 hypothetical protein GCM10010339_71030 [Streptomyces alanosinicus]